MTVKLPKPKVLIVDGEVFVSLPDGRSGSTLISKWPRLRNASREELDDFYLSEIGIHWPKLDEDLSFEGIVTSN